MIGIYINNKQQEVEESQSVKKLLEDLQLQRKGIAVALNEIVIPKCDWKEQIVQEGDHLTIVRAVQGG